MNTNSRRRSNTVSVSRRKSIERLNQEGFVESDGRRASIQRKKQWYGDVSEHTVDEDEIIEDDQEFECKCHRPRRIASESRIKNRYEHEYRIVSQQRNRQLQRQRPLLQIQPQLPKRPNPRPPELNQHQKVTTTTTSATPSIRDKAMKHKLQQLIHLTLQLYLYSLKLTFQLLIQPIFLLIWKETTKFMKSLNPDFIQDVIHQLLNLLILCLGCLGSSLKNFVDVDADVDDDEASHNDYKNED
ncbi:unnamed protein product [Ambrosiozyma monospora]|uniref:Unnamed protein product n=1 Tax=Ambrosiozyma monospora TaxID=43982 RepID=A0ACB5UDW3_AMBMO|nr:unnamed protein product [Ambrosiozyma monospora]